MIDSRKDTGSGGTHPGRRQFIRTLGAASMAAAGLGAFGRSLRAAEAVLDPGAPLRVGMIGTTGHTYMVFQTLQEVTGAMITAHAFEDGSWKYNTDGSVRGGSYDLDARRKWVEGQPWSKGGTKVYETYQEMLDREELDIVVVALPYARNPFASAAAAERGIHVMSEKPLAVTFDDLAMLHTAVGQNNVRLTAMFAMRFPPAYYTIKQMVAAGAIGIPVMARGQKSYRWGEERPWFYRHREIYGGTILWVAIHAIDWLYWVMDRPVRRVSAFHGNMAHDGYPGAQDNAVVNLEFEGGGTGAVTADYLRPAEAPTHGDDRLRVIGSEGVIEKKDLEETVELITHANGPRNVELQSPPAQWFPDFCASLRGQRQHIISADDPFEVTRICIAATAAADSGRVVEL
ncbi:MAG: Gfo/Idh/MocA family oxidoreductase [Candidatus Glassbacteria bacterium]|nr:Gfo/Idh/MocA family oxidoreductase [Candidatus Glassbacteria bacterium]